MQMHLARKVQNQIVELLKEDVAVPSADIIAKNITGVWVR